MEKAINVSTSVAHRFVDGIILFVMIFLFWQGYSTDSYGRFGLRRYDPTSTLLVPIAFVCVLYPFRVHTRLLWGTMMPISLFVAPILGAQARTRLTIAPGREPEIELVEICIRLLLFGGLVLAWLVPVAFGFQIEQKRQKHEVPRTASLSELILLTSLFCVTLILIRQTISFHTTFSIGDFSWLLLFHKVVFLFLMYGSLLWLGFHCRWHYAIVLPLLGFFCACFYQWGLVELVGEGLMGRGVALSRYRGGYVGSDAVMFPILPIIIGHSFEFGVLAFVVYGARLFGFRLVKNKSIFVS